MLSKRGQEAKKYIHVLGHHLQCYHNNTSMINRVHELTVTNHIKPLCIKASFYIPENPTTKGLERNFP